MDFDLIHAPVAVWTLGDTTRLGASFRHFPLERLLPFAPRQLRFTELYVRTRSGNIYLFEAKQGYLFVTDARSKLIRRLCPLDLRALRHSLLSWPYDGGALYGAQIAVGTALVLRDVAITSEVVEILAVTDQVIYRGNDMNRLRFMADMYTEGRISVIRSQFLQHRAPALSGVETTNADLLRVPPPEISEIRERPTVERANAKGPRTVPPGNCSPRFSTPART
jgi:hypothetical protein